MFIDNIEDVREFAAKVFAAVDTMDDKQLLAFLTEDGSFVFANAEPLVGHSEIGAGVRPFFSMLTGISHDLIEVWRCDDTIISQLTVTYTRQDGSELTFPGVTIWKMECNLISSYRIYVDNSALFAQ